MNLWRNMTFPCITIIKGNPPEHGVCLPWELTEGDYEFVKKYEHRCPKCGNVMRKIDEDNVPSLSCPNEVVN